MITGYKLRKELKWLNITFIVFAVLIILLKGISNLNILLFSIILFIIGSFREYIYVEPSGIVFKSYLLFFIPLLTQCPFHEATNISFENLDNGFTVIKYLKGNKLKRILIEDKDVKQVKEWIKKQTK
ncbi:hypothetical protein [Paramaledivibacter caminithermalis]|jgi:hypothetical protein|uniref:PH domain-containing protein n=1 Tax=Paramaledivibacter caminithermalis (strain DSM 15212 / CIP 107654 / DViRD3) TaxID=1121301 RepID=A0A1M6QLS6_PARC5|nr:hypothetical protein [Paramaledivibacter caminithermalis]SHK21214.1 hypothetical protein SAMN02745912_02629 [Paramaledivibacter caminithermalis DSM 15212]